MKPVALDATLWDAPITGIGLYLRQLHRGLAARGVAVERWGADSSGELPRRTVGRTAWTIAALPTLLARRRPRLFHALANFNLPLQRVPQVPFVLTVHDLVPLLLPHTVSRAFRWQFRLWLARSLEVAAHVICVSETTRASLCAHFDVDPAKLSVVHHGVDHVDSTPRADAVTEQWLDALGLDGPFVLYAGALDARKNVQLVLAAMERLHQGGRRVPLVLAGQRWFGGDAIERAVQRTKQLGVSVRALGYLADPVFYALMRRATAFVFPSRYEGFGLPPLEAMRLGVPTIVSTEGALPEVCGDGAWQVGPDDAAGLAAQLETLLGSAAARTRLSTLGEQRSEAFTWANAARGTQRAYDAASGQTPD